MSKTVSVALWIAGTMAIIAVAVIILWPMIEGLLKDANKTRPTFPTTPSSSPQTMIEKHFEYDEQPVGVHYELV